MFHPEAMVTSSPACPCRSRADCRYFLQPKAAIMSHLEDAVKGSDSELKKLNSSRCGARRCCLQGCGCHLALELWAAGCGMPRV